MRRTSQISARAALIIANTTRSYGPFAASDLFGFMAYITTKYCTTCDRDTSHTNGTCNHCRERIRREEMAAWQAKTVEEKLLDLHKRTLKLEAGPARY